MNPLTVALDRLERLRRLCLALPEATEQEAWGDPTWRVRGKIFAMQKGNFAGGRPSVWMKAAPGGRGALLKAHPLLVFVPPYVGHKGWMGVYLDGARLPWTRIGEWLAASYAEIGPKRLTARNAAGKPAAKRSRQPARRRLRPATAAPRAKR